MGRGEGIQKGRRISREERTMILAPKRQEYTKSKNKQEFNGFLASRNLVEYVHRTTYKRLSIKHVIEKSERIVIRL